MPLERAIGQAILKGLAGEGLSINRMISIARQAGGGYRYQTMRQDANKYLGTFYKEGSIAALRPETVVPQHLMSETVLNEDVKYRVFGWATVYEEGTEEPVEIPVSYYTDDLGDADESARQFLDFYSGRYEEQDLQVVDFRRRFVEHNEGWSY